MESAYKERVKNFETLLVTQDKWQDLDKSWTAEIDMKSFREACFYGIPDEPGLRSAAWKVLMGYLPPDKRLWEDTLKTQRTSYYNWVKDLLEEEPIDDSLSDHASIKSYLNDNLILDQIDKDVRRTLPDFAFFQLHVPMNHLNPLSPPLMLDSPHSMSDSDFALGEKEQSSMARRFSFGLMNRPRSSSSASKKSFKANGPSMLDTRDRSNSKSSVRSFSSVLDNSEIISTPKNIVRKLSTAFKSNNTSYSNNSVNNNNNNSNTNGNNINNNSNNNINNVNGSYFNLQKPVKHTHHSVLEPICPYIPNRRTIFRRIAHLNEEIGNREHQDTEKATGQKAFEADAHIMDYHWEAIERILFIYAKLNPGVGYVQGMNELLAPIYYVFAKDEDPESQAYAEADSFFIFTTLMADVRDHFVRSLDSDTNSGINATLWRMSQRLAWFDRPLFRDLSKKDIKEQYYAFRWVTVLCSQEWDLPDVIRLWDSILADRGMQEEEGCFEFLLDFAVAMLICIRQDLIQGDFAENMKILQNYPIDDLQVVLNSAYSIRDTRLQAIATGKIIPGVNDRRSSGLVSGDWSDTSSISSTGSNRFKKFKDTTEFARASIDSLRRGSKESFDDIFKRSLSITRDNDKKRSSTGDVTKGLSQKLGFSNLAAQMRRTSSVRSANAIEEQIQKDWLLANQLDAMENRQGESRMNGLRPVDTMSSMGSTSSTASRASSFLSRFSQMMNSSNKSVSPYDKNLEQQQQAPEPEKKQYSHMDSRNIAVSNITQAYRSYV
ncbi:RabGAP/TBC [Backusella circina FSU 941]|nr:RabGAP/TBC [Backusella circina FSU 941]